jgi:hypothetical protein
LSSTIRTVLAIPSLQSLLLDRRLIVERRAKRVEKWN